MRRSIEYGLETCENTIQDIFDYIIREIKIKLAVKTLNFSNSLLNSIFKHPDFQEALTNHDDNSISFESTSPFIRPLSRPPTVSGLRVNVDVIIQHPLL